MDVDAQLLDRYARTSDADAFTQLVRRHAGMVFAVARRITSNHHDAEEVAQVCFLELARQVPTINSSLAGWLHTTATHRATDLNRAAARRRHYEQAALRPEVCLDTTWDQLAPLIDSALAELPEELRLPLVLYHLEGRTQKQVAAELGIGASTVCRRVEAGVAALREKLTAAGLVAPSLSLSALLSTHALEAAPKTLVAALGKLAVSGFVPAASGAGSGAASSMAGSGGSVASTSGGGGVACGPVSVVAKGSMPLISKIAAAIAFTTAISTAGYMTLRPHLTAVSVAQADGVAPNRQPMSAELKQVITRLKAEISPGMGNGLAIRTRTRGSLNDPKNIHQPEEVFLYAQHGDSRLRIVYQAGRKADWGNPQATLPSAWEPSHWDEMLHFLSQLRSPDLKVMNGQALTYSESQDHSTNVLVSARLDDDSHQAGSNIPNPFDRIWPDPQDLSSESGKDWSRRVELVRRPETPSLLGVRLTFRNVIMPFSKWPFYGQNTTWLDPDHHDIPVELDWQPSNKKGQQTGFWKFEFFEYAQLPDGRSYPTYWRETNESNKQYADYRLFFDPARSLDSSWFNDPAAHFTADTGNSANAKSPSIAMAPNSIVAAATHAIHADLAQSIWWWWPWALAVVVFGAAAALVIRQRFNQSSMPALRGSRSSRPK